MWTTALAITTARRRLRRRRNRQKRERGARPRRPILRRSLGDYMAGTVKGITIEFRGDTTKLDKAIRDVNKETRGLDSELKDVNRALKFNPKNIDLWRQKQQLLTEKVQKTKEKLDLLKKAQAKLDADGVDKNSEQYRKLQREIIETESKVKNFKGQLDAVGNVNLKAAAAQVEEVGNKLTAAGEALTPISAAAGALATAIGALTYKSGSWADDLNTMSKVYGIGTQELQKYAAQADLVDVELETIASAHSKLTRNMAAAQKGTKAQAAAFKKLRVSVTDSNGNLRNSDDVFNDVISALGKMENETERDAAAMDIFGKSAMELNPLIEDNGKTYKQLSETFEKYGLKFVDQETLDAANDFNDSLDTMKAIGAVTLQSIGTQLAGYFAPALQKVVDLVGQLAAWLNTLSPETLAMITTVAAVIAVLAPLLLILGQLAFAVSSIITLVSTLGPVFAVLTGPVGIAIAIIAALIAIGVLLYKNWDKIKAKASEIWQGVVDTFEDMKNNISIAIETLQQTLANVWNKIRTTAATAWNMIKMKAMLVWGGIKKAITDPIAKARDKIQEIFEKIKTFFPINVGNILSGIKLPHFSISGELDLKKGKVPHLAVDWYAKGGIFDSPSIIGVGEAGPEAVVPLDRLWSYLDTIVANGGGGTVINVYGSDNMSVNDLAAAVEARIIAMQKRRALAWQ